MMQRDLLKGMSGIENKQLVYKKVKTMTLEDRISKIKLLEKKYPELAEQYKWYTICRAIEFCKTKDISSKLSDDCDELLNQVEFDLAELVQIQVSKMIYFECPKCKNQSLERKINEGQSYSYVEEYCHACGFTDAR